MDPRIELNERVEVVATFEDGLDTCVPRKFRRPNGREVVVTELGLRHPMAAGRRMLHVFDVTDGGSDYRLVLDAERLTWRLVYEAEHE